MLRFACVGARPEPFAAAPAMLFTVRVSDDSGRRVHSVALRCQFRIEPRGRTYTPAEQARLVDLFGDPSRWGTTTNPLQLATIGLTVNGFTGSTDVDVTVPLTYDMDIAATKYFHGLDSDTPPPTHPDTPPPTRPQPGRQRDVPLLLLFSGTVYYAGDDGVQLGLVSWHAEAPFRLPAATWRAAMDEHYPDSTWVRVTRPTLDALSAYRSERVIPTWDETFEHLLKEAGGQP